jgi:hypothetical protein
MFQIVVPTAQAKHFKHGGHGQIAGTFLDCTRSGRPLEGRQTRWQRLEGYCPVCAPLASDGIPEARASGFVVPPTPPAPLP